MEISFLPIQPAMCKGQKVLSSNQLAALFKSTRQTITDIYRRHKTEFITGVDYFFLEKEDLYAFKVENGLFEENEENSAQSAFPNLAPIRPFSRTANSAYVWTVDGVLKMAKFIHTKRADIVIQNWLPLYFSNDDSHFVFPNPDTVVRPVFPNRANPNCVVYAMELDDGTIKIGRTSAIDVRPKEIENQLSCKVLRIHHTDFLPKNIAVKIETACCKALNPFLAHGKEFFNVPFEDACNVIEQYCGKIKNDFLPLQKYNELKFLIELCTDTALRDDLIRAAYNILKQ